MNELLHDSGGLVKIEDILPLFPDFAQVDSFKDAICKSLSDYNAQIEGLKEQMADATQIADALRCTPPTQHRAFNVLQFVAILMKALDEQSLKKVWVWSNKFHLSLLVDLVGWYVPGPPMWWQAGHGSAG